MTPTTALTFLLLVFFAHCTPSIDAQVDEVARLRSIVKQLGIQLIRQDQFITERIRSDGHSGIKQVRPENDGIKSYYTGTWVDNALNSIHNHADNIRTLGMGEVIAVLNGVEFRTRHNDYKLVMPSTTSSAYHAVEDIPFPAPPPQVLSKPTLLEQCAEMREFFKAFRDDNVTHRDYRPYFKANLCYLEGAFTNDEQLDEPFASERHQLVAKTWFELLEQIRFTSATGDKDNNENYAYLPNKIQEVKDDGTPVIAQWNYRILCHPIKGELKRSQLTPLDNIARRMTTEEDFDSHLLSRAARFIVDPNVPDPEYYINSRLDKLMMQIPGKDNYLANLTDTFQQTKLDIDSGKPLNAGFYNRWYKLAEEGAMGTDTALRGFADRNLFVAQTTQPRVTNVSLETCVTKTGQRVCSTTTKRVSYAIPLEIVYTTPLHAWNPYNIEYKGSKDTPTGLTVTAAGRNGGATLAAAFNGTNSVHYYRTPVEFFSGDEVDEQAADTPLERAGVLDKDGKLRIVKASGIRIFLPEIAGVGRLRTRYPISPVHVEGSAIWKEVEALRDLVLDMQSYLQVFITQP